MKKYLFGFFAVLFALPAFGVFTKAELDALNAEAGSGMELIDAGTELCTELCGANGCSIDCENKTVSCTNAITASGVTLSNNEKKQKIEEHCKAFQPQSNTTGASQSGDDGADAGAPAAATMTISGRIVDEKGEPLFGATIVPSGESTGIGTTSDMDGNFTLNNFPSDRDVQISYIGFKDQTLTPGQNMNITLTEDAELLDEIVVKGQWKSRACNAEELAAINATSGHTARNANGNGVYCVPDDCAYGYTLNKKTNTCDALNCESPRYVLNAAGDKCEDQVGKECTATDTNASKSEYVWENNTLKCKIKKCNKGYLLNDAGTACDVSEGPCTDDQVQQIEHATAGELKLGVCHATECDAGYEVSDGKCIAISGNCSPMPENATSAHREYDSTAGVEACIIDACRDGYSVSNDKKSCIEPTLSQADAQKQIAELQENADAMREREQSLANRMVGGASMGAMGIGGMQVASALAEQNADADAERDMAAYLATFKCDYGAGMTITGGETGIVLPGANVLLPIYNEYTTLAADLKTRKESLGMAPGIESEVILDAATSGLYDNVSTGITDGAYASISRALSNPTGADAAEWAAQKSDTASQLTTGAIVAGAGALVGIAGNVLTNYVGDKPREMSDEIIAEYDAKRRLIRTELAEVEQESETEALASAPTVEPGKEPSTAETNCKSDGGTWNGTTCTCPGDKIWNETFIRCEQNPSTVCTQQNGDWDEGNHVCICPNGPWDSYTPQCITDEHIVENINQYVPEPVIQLYSDEMFDSGSITIKNTDNLDKTISVLQQKISNDYLNNAKLVLVAHTDADRVRKDSTTLSSLGITDNKQLSERRGQEVKNYITRKWSQFPQENIHVIAAGDECANTCSGLAKALYRKVDFYIFFGNEDTSTIQKCGPDCKNYRASGGQ